MIILIPAYEPDDKLVRLVESIGTDRRDQTIVVVNDGSNDAFSPIFEAVRELGCDVIGHLPNRGKGFALKHGFAYVAANYPGRDVVSADCDGQHTIVDILRVADALHEHRSGLVLGARQFVGDVPARSRFGNNATRFALRLIAGVTLQDTQTGLRGYPAWMLDWLQSVDGDRFEYELEVLLGAKRMGFEFHEISIETIYLDGNESSHFHAIRDSIRVYVPFLKFSISSLAAFAIDAALFFGLMTITGHLAASVVLARLVSASFNYASNRRLVFDAGRDRTLSGAIRYATLVFALMTTNYIILAGLTGAASIGLVGAKFTTELLLFVVSYQVQRRFVFRDSRRDIERLNRVDGNLTTPPTTPPTKPQDRTGVEHRVAA